ncbi:cbb3-type cytochrome c oxidase subunit I [Pseudoroseicyclus aestuarii]|uniref:Cytochrome o ubiquinol oxidase subunit 1 n=1 Tax=Pseudoroseicyclus aestuarii TaxID=1795041 RepID=A0A318T0M7_9RHOB|nr:cbb3-type cytochrome c oxidase subunit I [Pseudoroseicyclus aestuarii]PYE86179.1 cytochrome o ubiquinol oxidase subunit 1 [Pseudoroseicyclus aestuarii]
MSLLGILGWSDIIFVKAWQNPSISEAIAAGAGGAAVLGALGAAVLVTWLGAWRTLWTGWLTSLDHKKIGIMYIVLALVMIARALIEAVLMRVQQAAAVGDPGFLSADHYNQLFTTHGTIMIFFMAMPFLTGVINYVMPLQIGSRDMSFPMMNAVSLWLTVGGAILMMASLIFGSFSTGGWSAYPPYTGASFSPGVGVDYWIWAVTLASVGSTLTGINIAVTIYKRRAPGMTLFHMPLFCWTALAVSILMIFAMSPLTVATAMLALDRYAEFKFFTNGDGGNMMIYANLFWLFGHPEVYILILPAFGVYSEVFTTFSGKTLYGYRSLVLATMCIAVLSFTVWLHHFFTMGQSAEINAAFGIATMLIGIPTGVKVYDWLLTMVRGRIVASTALIFSSVFLVTFVVGGVTGIILANPDVDYQVHNSLFLVAHFHNMLIPGLLFGMIAAVQVWFPKAFGFRLDERWGRISALLWTAGFYLAFMPLYAMGLGGAMRRMRSWADPDWWPWLLAAEIGAFLLLGGLATLLMQFWVSVRNRRALAVPGGDPWDGRTLEWGTSSPPPEYNFAVVPQVDSRDAFTAVKAAGRAYSAPETYEDIEMPKATMVPLAIGLLAAACGFGLTWHIWWLALLAFIGIWGAVILRSFQRETSRVIPAAEVARQHEAWLEMVRGLPQTPRRAGLTPANSGRAEQGEPA